jgi:hypothetical protein
MVLPIGLGALVRGIPLQIVCCTTGVEHGAITVQPPMVSKDV